MAGPWRELRGSAVGVGRARFEQGSGGDTIAVVQPSGAGAFHGAGALWTWKASYISGSASTMLDGCEAADLALMAQGWSLPDRRAATEADLDALLAAADDLR